MMKMTSPTKPTRSLLTRKSRPPRDETFASHPCLRFSPTAWAKLLYLRDAGETEVGGFAITPADDLLYVEDFQLVRQTCGVASVAFDDQSVADYFDRQVDAGRSLGQVARIWVHTHPGSCPQPSSTDEETFARVFGRTDWSVMFILARGGQTYCRLEFHVGPGGSLLLPVEVEYRRPFAGSDLNAWQAEYLANVEVDCWPALPADEALLESASAEAGLLADYPDWFDFCDDLLKPKPAGRPPATSQRLDDDHHATT